MVRPERLELPAYWFEASRSIQLSYGRAFFNDLTPTQCRIEIPGNGSAPSRFYQRTDLFEGNCRGGGPNAVSCNFWLCAVNAVCGWTVREWLLGDRKSTR